MTLGVQGNEILVRHVMRRASPGSSAQNSGASAAPSLAPWSSTTTRAPFASVEARSRATSAPCADHRARARFEFMAVNRV